MGVEGSFTTAFRSSIGDRAPFPSAHPVLGVLLCASVHGMDRGWARLWFAVTFVAMVTGVVITLILAGKSSGFGGSPVNRALNQFAFFTIQSNLIVGVTSLMLAVRLDRTSVVFSVFRLTGLIAITVTGIIFQTVLGGSHLHLHSWVFVANLLQHIVVPIMSVVGWLVFGPRGQTSWRIAGLTLIFPSLTSFSPSSGVRCPQTGIRIPSLMLGRWATFVWRSTAYWSRCCSRDFLLWRPG